MAGYDKRRLTVNGNRFYVDESRPWFSDEASWPEEVPKNLELDQRNLYQVLEESEQAFGDMRAIWFQPLEAVMTYSELKNAVDRLATGFHSLGIRKGDVVAFMLPNSFQYVTCYYACMRIGAIASGINPTYKSGEVLHQLETTSAKALVVLDALFKERITTV